MKGFDTPASPGEKRAWLRRIMAGPWKPAAKLVAYALAERHNCETGQLNPSAACLARDTGLSLRAVQYGLAELEEGGAIAALGGRRAGGLRAVNRYRLVLAGGVRLVADRDSREVQDLRETTQNLRANYAKSAQEPILEPEKELGAGLPAREAEGDRQADGASRAGGQYGAPAPDLFAASGDSGARDRASPAPSSAAIQSGGKLDERAAQTEIASRSSFHEVSHTGCEGAEISAIHNRVLSVFASHAARAWLEGASVVEMGNASGPMRIAVKSRLAADWLRGNEAAGILAAVRAAGAMVAAVEFLPPERRATAPAPGRLADQRPAPRETAAGALRLVANGLARAG